jgi:hypothetical protein
MPVVWQSGFHDRVLRSGDDPCLLARYIVENPVRAKIVEQSDQYPFGGIIDDWR